MARRGRRAATRYTHCRTGQGQPERLAARSGTRTGRNAGGAGKGMKTETTSSELWRPEAKRGQNWRTWEDLDDKRWIVLVEKDGGQGGRDGGE